MTAKRRQQEALDYFSGHATEWSDKASGRYPSSVNVVKQRNDYVLHVISERPTTRIALDVGCGTGDLILDLVSKGIPGVGVDFAPEMIQIATDRVSQENLPLPQFHCMTIFDFDMSEPSYDCISANGFIEYISYDQLLQFIDLAHGGLRSGGSLVMGSRNRLFNLFSLNDFTNQEIQAGTVLQLLREMVAMANVETLSELLPLEPVPLPEETVKQMNTGIDVSIRLQYTPIQLMTLLQNHGFEVVDIYPIHVHGVIPRFKDYFPQLHIEMCDRLQVEAQGHLELVPQSSSFMIHAKKAA